MNMKKILALTIVVLALFGCMSAASAGLFDWFNSGPANQTYTFDGFTLDLPENANITNNTYNNDGTTRKVSSIELDNSSGGSDYVKVSVATGPQLVTSVDEYVSNWVSEGATPEGKYGDWSIININGVKMDFGSNYNFNLTYSGYILAKHTGSKLIFIQGDNLAQLKSIVDTYKEV